MCIFIQIEEEIIKVTKKEKYSKMLISIFKSLARDEQIDTHSNGWLGKFNIKKGEFNIHMYCI